MGKVFQNKPCDKCGKVGKVIQTFGVNYCKECFDKKPKKGDGHSGMILKPLQNQDEFMFSGKTIELTLCPKSDQTFCNLFLTHYPESKGIVGRSLNYIIRKDGQLAGIVSACSPPYNYKLFEKYFGITDNTRYDMTKQFLNNNAYNLTLHEKNFGTKVLRIFRETVIKDYKTKFGDNLLGMVTFVEKPRTGAMYRADNWDFLGETEGIEVKRRGDLGKWVNKEYTNTGNKKLIFAKRFK